MFSMEMGSVHSKGNVRGHIFSCRPDDTGRDGTVTLAYYHTYQDGSQITGTALHTFEVGFRVTNLYDYQAELKMDLQDIRVFLNGLVRRHFEIQMLLGTSHRGFVIRDLEWRL
ncbi:hypothetical protein [Xanthomonas phage RTH11]|nr:hypothetical protein [Xanthomonas phage RTH11]